MAEKERPGLTVTEEPGGMLRKRLMDYDGTILVDETILPHPELGAHEFTVHWRPELDLDNPIQRPAEEILFTPWEKLVERDIFFDPKRHFQSFQLLDLRVENPQWKYFTAQDMEKASKHGNESLREKYKK